MSQDDEWNINYYTELLSRFGIDTRALDWGSRESQELRFAILQHIGDIRHHSILDVGCGQGDLYSWLLERGAGALYTGVDITPGMIATAQRRFPHGQFVLGNLLEPGFMSDRSFDYVVASGIFAHRLTDPYAYLRETVSAMFARCTTAVGFNTLSMWATDKEAGEFHADPTVVLDICRTITAWIVFRHDYHPRDFCIYLYRERHLP